MMLLLALLATAQEPVRQAPKRLVPGDHGVGRRLPDLDFTDLAGKRRKLSEVAPRKPLVVALTSTSCPIGRKYAPALARLEDVWRARGVQILYVAPLAADGAAELAAAAKELGLEAPVARDPDGALARALGAITTTDAFLLDAARTLIYRGAVDDQYGLGYSLDAPRTQYLAEAVDALLAGRAPAVAATWAPGCDLDLAKAPAPAAVAATWHNRISRIAQRACLDCHRKGGVGPFALESYADLAAHKGMIKRVVESGSMPPWSAAAPAGGASPWANDTTLSTEEKKDLLDWLAGGLPEGVAADAPLPRRFPDGWRIGKPDAIIELPRAVEIKAEGTMPYVNLEVETGFAEERWVRAIEIVPTAPEVVHHVLVFAQPPKGQRKRSLEDGIAYFAVYVPGQSHVVYPEGYGRKVPAGATLKFQLHYTPTGKATRDRTKVGFVFSKTPPKHEVKTAAIANPFFSIPPGAGDHAVKAWIPVPKGVELLSYFPHMHLRGKSIRYDLVLPGEKRELLLDVPRYDFNWQFSYVYAERRAIPAGSRLEVTGVFDNSANNPANPDATKTVRWGEQTHEEMLIGFVEYVVP